MDGLDTEGDKEVVKFVEEKEMALLACSGKRDLIVVAYMVTARKKMRMILERIKRMLFSIYKEPKRDIKQDPFQILPALL